MPAALVRIDPRAQRTLRQLAALEGEPMTAVLRKAIESYRRKRLLEQVNRGYSALRRRPKAWKEELQERRLWEAAVGDGLEDD